jgi:hypothetical protein
MFVTSLKYFVTLWQKQEIFWQHLDIKLLSPAILGM